MMLRCWTLCLAAVVFVTGAAGRAPTHARAVVPPPGLAARSGGGGGGSWEASLPTLAVADLAKKYGRNNTTGLSPSLLLSGASANSQDEAAEAAEMFQAERESILDAMRNTVRTGGSMDGIINRTEKLFRDTLAKYHAKTPQLRDLLVANAADSAARLGGTMGDASAGAAALASPPPPPPSSFLELGADVGVAGMEGGCEVCVYVLENKQMRQPFLCRGLKAAQYQQVCVSVLVSLMWWLENEVYWVNYGCQRSNGYDKTSFCPDDPTFRRPVQ